MPCDRSAVTRVKQVTAIAAAAAAAAAMTHHTYRQLISCGAPLVRKSRLRVTKQTREYPKEGII